MLYRGTPTIEVIGKPGIYTMVPESDTGKTYLARSLRNRWKNGEPVFSYDCELYSAGVMPWNMMKEQRPELFMFDRADHYCSDVQLVRFLRSIRDSAVVLLDVKCLWNFPINCKFADIILYPSKLEVICG